MDSFRSPDAYCWVLFYKYLLAAFQKTGSLTEKFIRDYVGPFAGALIAAFVYDYLAREILCLCTTIICKIDNLLPINVINSRSESLSMLPINLSFIPSITFNNQ
jgi:hypothetical protein